MSAQMHKYWVGCWLLLFTSTLFSQTTWPETVAPDTEFSLLTASPGSSVHNIFGHSALRMRNEGLNLDIVFNWGTFNYKTDRFVIKFIQGKLPYKLSINPYRYFKQSYVDQDRTLTEVVFNLDQSQKQKLNELLQENYLEENRTYRYDFFYDNCSTRIRDIIETTMASEMQGPPKKFTTSFKGLLQPYLSADSWLRLGINLILGDKANDNVNFRTAMFLPKYLEGNLKKAELDGKSIINSENTIYQGNLKRKASPLFPIIPFGILLILGIVGWFRNRYSGGSMRILDKLVFSILGLAGWFFVFMWLGTKHIATHQNAHLLWALPIYFPMVWFLKGKQLRYLLFLSLALIFIYFAYSFRSDFYVHILDSPAILAIIALILVRIFYYLRVPKTV